VATIQHYELGKKLGSGDMGSVFQATDTRTDEQVALKILHNIDMQSAMDRGAAAEVLEFAAGITHAAMHPILKVIDTDERGGILAVAMPLAAASVYDFMQAGKRIPPNRVYTVIETIASVLQNLHQNEIAHGSVKPTNVLLDRSGNAALTDLAMAHLRDMGMIPAEATLLQQHYIHVDLMYHSTPEFAADIFALATLAYHMLTYKLPHSDPRPAIRQSEKPSQETLGSEMFAVLLRGMTHRKMLVYPDVGSFMEDFKCAFNGQSIDSETEHWFRVKVRSDDEDED
jgi:eukaryotic-like serine/threonine-protein kinase